jgi:hypothetical protein
MAGCTVRDRRSRREGWVGGKRKRYVPDMALHRDELEQLAQDRFAFLTREKGFTLRLSQQKAQWTNYDYTNPLASIGVEVQLDFRDDTVRVHLLRLRDGELPPHGFVDVDRGERIAVAFQQLLKNILRIEDARLDALYEMLYATPSPAQPRDHHWADEVLARWQDVVERYIDPVAQQPIEVLFPPPPPGASPASQA